MTVARVRADHVTIREALMCVSHASAELYSSFSNRLCDGSYRIQCVCSQFYLEPESQRQEERSTGAQTLHLSNRSLEQTGVFCCPLEAAELNCTRSTQ